MTNHCNLDETCTTQASTTDCCDMPERLLKLADDAWFEVLKEKIKEEINANCDGKMAEIAKLVASSNQAKWGNMIQGKVQCEEYKQSLKNLMTSCDCKS